MKKILAIIFSLAILSGCAAGTGTEVSETSVTSGTVTASESTVTTAETTTKITTATTTVSETTAVTEEKILTAAELGVNGDGSLSEVFTSRLADFAAPYIESGGIRVYPALYDFDYDGVPEIILIHHNSGQGLMPCEVYSAYDFEKLGEFEGFCRDGFTRFSAGRKGGTIIHNYYEHSNWQRSENVLYASITDGKFTADPLYNRYGQTVGGQYNAVMSINEVVDKKTFGKLYSVDFLDKPDTLMGYVEFSDKDIKPDIQSRFAEEYAAESYYADADYNSESLSAAVTESYNNYIRLKRLSNYDDKDTYCLVPMGDKNQTAFFFDKNGVFFIDETDKITQLSDLEYFYSVKKLWDSLVVFQLFGNTSPCFVYSVSGGEPRLIEEINGDAPTRGSGMYFDYSSLYNGGFEMIHSVYDATSFGAHTFKKYQFYFSADGIREYGSIVVPWEEFSSAYESTAKKYADELAAEGYEIYEVLYRGDYCFILNCRQQLYAEDPPEPINGYNNMYIVLKPFIDPAFNGFDEIERDWGFYLTALIPEIAVYPEKYYKEGEDWDKCTVKPWG